MNCVLSCLDVQTKIKPNRSKEQWYCYHEEDNPYRFDKLFNNQFGIEGQSIKERIRVENEYQSQTDEHLTEGSEVGSYLKELSSSCQLGNKIQKSYNVNYCLKYHRSSDKKF